MTTRDDLVSRLRGHADDCEDMAKWATPELAPLLRRAADRITSLERQLAEERERCARIAETLPMGMFNHPQAIASAIRGGAK